MYDYSLTLILLVAVLLAIFLWKSFKRSKSKEDPPSYYTIFIEIIYAFLTNRSKYLPFKSVMFQKVNAASKRFEEEGMFYCWCFRRMVFIFGEDATKNTILVEVIKEPAACVVTISDVAYNETFVTNEASADKPPNYEILKEGFGEGLVSSNGETWKKDRKMLNPVFNMGMLKGVIPIFNENADNLVKKLEEVVNKPSADLVPYLRSCAFYNLCECILNVNMKEKESEQTIERLLEVMEELQEFVTSRWILPTKIAKLSKFFTPTGWKYMKLYKEGQKSSEKIVSDMIKSVALKSRDSEKSLDQNQKSLASTLVEYHLKDPSFTLRHFQDHVNTFAVSGFDTIVYSMLWCLFLLGLHKDVQEKAYDEVQSVAGEFVTYEDLSQLVYLQCIIKETLRLYPTVPAFARYLKKDIQCGKYKVPKDSIICIFLYRLHRNSKIYPDPEKFDPDRFRSSTNADRRKWAHLPFSEGYRSCIGKKFAVMQMKLNLVYILRNYHITSLDRREDLDLNWNILLSPTRPLRIRLTPRQILLGDS